MGKQLSTNPSAVRAREYRAKKAAKQGILIENVVAQPAPLETNATIDDLTIDVAENTAPKPSLKERLFGVQVATPKSRTAKKGQRGKQIDASLMSKVLPTMISASVAMYAQKLIKHPYKACAPTQQEVYGTVAPLFSILSRRIEIVGTASEDMIDLITALLTSLCTGIRIHITYLSIQEQIERAKQHDGHVNVHANGRNASHDRRETTINSSREDAISVGLGTNSSTDVTDGSTDITDGDSGTTKREAAMFAELFKRDMQGRKQLGLLA